MNSAAGSFGLSFGLAMAGGADARGAAVLVHDLTEQSTVLTPAEQQQVATALEEDAELMSNTALDEMLAGQPRRPRTRSSASTPRRGRSRSRSRSWCPLLAGCSGCSTRCG